MNIWNNRNWGPMLLKEIDKPFDSQDHLYEIKFDGIRAIIFATPQKVVVQTRNKKDISNIFPELQKIKDLVKEKTIFDGEIVSFKDNLPSFSKLQERNHLKNETKIREQAHDNPVVYVCFDILYKNNKDLTGMPLIERKKILDKYKDNEVFVLSKYIAKDGVELFKKAKKIGLEGIIAKDKNSPYLISDRNDFWLKIKNLKSDTFYIGGYTDTNKNESITLYLGEKRDNKLYFVGKVAMAKKRPLFSKIMALKIRKTSPFKDYEKDINYITPTLKCEIKYLERTKRNHLRQPIFKGEAK